MKIQNLHFVENEHFQSKMKQLTLILISALMLTQLATAQRATTNLQAQLLNTEPFPVEAGEDADIRFAIRNTGNTEADNVTVTLQNTFPFQVKPDRQQTYNIGSIAPGEKYYISTEVLVADNAPDGQDDFKVRLENGNIARTVNVPVEVSSQDVELNVANIKTSPSDLKPDSENNELSIDVVNNGDSVAENVVVNIQLPEGFEQISSLSTRQSLGNIGAGETKTATFNFDITDSVEKGQVDIPTNTTYSFNDSNAEIAVQRNIGLFLSGAPQYEILNVESDLQTGERRQVRVTVQNTGSVESTSTRVRVLDNADLPFSFDSSSAFVGTLQPGQNGTAVFNIRTEQNAVAKDYLVDFEIRGVKDTEVFVEDQTLELDVQNGQSQTGLKTPFIVAGAVILLALIGAAYYLRN